MSFEARLKTCAEEIEDFLDDCILPSGNSALADAMFYSVQGGKKLRGFLVLETSALFDVFEEDAVKAAGAIEAMHAYSLIHDDLPCMDDDDLRRGKPTVHKKWDEATAVLAGDALQSLAYDLLATLSVDPDRRVELMSQLAGASGIDGMVLGQSLDIQAETATEALTLKDIQRIQSLKTGALIEWSAKSGPLMGGADAEPLARYAKNIGLAFQITDDILDVTGNEAKAGKRLKKDEAAGKATFVSVLGLEGAKQSACDLVAEAIDELCIYDARADNLRAAAQFVISREF